MDFDENPGEYRLVPAHKIGSNSLSTHSSTDLCIYFLKSMCDAEINVLGFQPAQLTLGATVSAEVAQKVEEAAQKLASLGIEAFKSKPGTVEKST